MSDVQSNIDQVQRNTGASMQNLEHLDDLKTKLEVSEEPKPSFKKQELIQLSRTVCKTGHTGIGWLGSINNRTGRTY